VSESQSLQEPQTKRNEINSSTFKRRENLTQTELADKWIFTKNNSRIEAGNISKGFYLESTYDIPETEPES
jgi:hypothetical protein